MVDEIVASSNESATTRFLVQSDNLFVEGGFLAESALVENVAQTVAAMVGYQCYQRNVPVPVGYIAAVKDLKILALPAVGTVLETVVTVRHRVMDVTIVDGVVEQSGHRLCACEMKVLARTGS